MLNQNKSKQVKMDYWLLKLLSKDMKTKTKNKDQPTKNIKNNRKVKAMGNITPTVNQYPRNGDTDSESDMLC